MPIENKKLITRAGLSKLGMRARNWYGLADSGTYKCVTAKEMCVEPFENPVPSDSIYDFNHEMGYSTDLSDEYSGNANKCLTFDPDFFTYNIKASVPIIFKITSNINACQASNI